MEDKIFTKEELKNISDLGDILFEIRQRLIREGKIKPHEVIK